VVFLLVYSISDLAIEAGVSYHTVYYYLREGLLKESLLVGNRQRIFDDHDLEKLKRIIELRKEGKSIEYIRSTLEREANNV
jgi:DNA-binding transcriptional MerR regulator